MMPEGMHPAPVVSPRAALAARGKSPSAFGERCIPPRCVAQRSNTPGILAFRALRSGRIVRLGATTDFHHGLQGIGDARILHRYFQSPTANPQAPAPRAT